MTKPSTSDPLFTVRGTELLAGDTREQYRQKLARITLDSMVQFVGLLDASGTVLEINQVALDAVGIRLSDVEGKPFWTTFWWQVTPEINAELREMIRSAAAGEFVRWDTQIYGRAGGKETIIIDASLMPVKDDSGNVAFITAEGRDITEKKAHEREIARQREELAELDKLKTKFFANISHEFRTPLTLMIGPLDDALADRDGLSVANRERLVLARRNSVRLLKLVDTLLDFSRIEAGRMTASDEPTDLLAFGEPVLLPTQASAKPQEDRELVIVADDNADMREYVSRLLKDEYRVIAVEDGQRAVDATLEHHPALLLTDVMMPRIDGFGVLQAIRSDSRVSETPVIFFSARAGEESRLEGLEAGADDYLVKPFTARELVTRVATHVKIARLRRETEKARRLYDTILSNTPDLAYVFDRNHRFIYANKALLAMWGRSFDDAIGKTCLELGYEPWHAAMHDREIEQVIATRKPIRGEVPFTGTNGRRIYDYIFVPVMGPSGEVEAIAGTTRDITERSAAEEALRQSEERLRAFVNATTNVAYRMNADWTEMKRLEGKDFIVDTSEPTREWLNQYIHPEDQPEVMSAIAEAIRARSIFELEHRVLRVDGTLGWTSSRAMPVISSDGEIVEWFGAAADITERKRAEEALRRSEKLAATGRLAATMAHEINNPLEAITNLVYLAKISEDRERSLTYLATAEEELERVSHLTKQTLGFYRETKGADAIRLSSIVKSLLSVFGSRIRNKKIVVETEVKSDSEISAVPGEIRQLIANLLSNSIDAVDNGGRIKVRISEGQAWNSERTRGVRLTIADNGPGIPSDIRPRLFEPFVTTKKDIGTGLGLWVCKSIVERHGGQIRLKSSITQGKSWTAFSVFLPAASDIAHNEA